MSTPFTVDGTNFQALEKLEELRLAYSERVYTALPRTAQSSVSVSVPLYKNAGVAGSTINYTPPYGHQRYVWDAVSKEWTWETGDGLAGDSVPSGVNIQAYRFFNEMQKVVACECWRFAKFGESPYNSDEARPEGYYNYAIADIAFSPNFENFSPYYHAEGQGCEKFFQYAGLWEDADNWGFRRAVTTSDGVPVIGRGFFEPGDILGSWIIEDLVCAFEKLTTTAAGIVGTELLMDLFFSYNLSGADGTLIDGGRHSIGQEYEGGPVYDRTATWAGQISRVLQNPLQTFYSDWAIVNIIAFGTPVVPITNVRKYYGSWPSITLIQGGDYAAGAAIALGGYDGGDVAADTRVTASFAVTWDFTNA